MSKSSCPIPTVSRTDAVLWTPTLGMVGVALTWRLKSSSAFRSNFQMRTMETCVSRWNKICESASSNRPGEDTRTGAVRHWDCIVSSIHMAEVGGVHRIRMYGQADHLIEFSRKCLTSLFEFEIIRVWNSQTLYH